MDWKGCDFLLAFQLYHEHHVHSVWKYGSCDCGCSRGPSQGFSRCVILHNISAYCHAPWSILAEPETGNTHSISSSYIRPDYPEPGEAVQKGRSNLSLLRYSPANMPSENSPLLSNGEETQRQPFSRRAISFMKGEGQPGFFQSYHYLFLESWVNLLLLFIPLSAVSHYLMWDAGLRFTLSFLAIIPLAKACSLRRRL